MWIYLHEISHPSFSSVEDITWAAFSQKWKCLAACALAFLTRYFWSRSLGTPRPDKTLLSTDGTQRDVSITQTGHRPTIPPAAQSLVHKKKTIYWTTYCNAQPFFFFVELCLVYMHSAQNASFLSVRLRRTSPHLLDKSRQREHASIELWLRLDFFIKKAPKFPTRQLGNPDNPPNPWYWNKCHTASGKNIFVASWDGIEAMCVSHWLTLTISYNLIKS